MSGQRPDGADSGDDLPGSAPDAESRAGGGGRTGGPGEAGGGGQNIAPSLDLRLFRALRTKGHQRPLELSLIIFTIAGEYGAFWLALAAAIWLAGARHDRDLILFMPVFLYPTLLVNFAIKTLLGRRRPAHTEEELKPLVGVPSSKSFPSSHAAMSFAAAIVLSHFYPGLWPLFFGLALLMSWSRVYVGVHYPSDVLGGTAVGLAMGGIILWLLG